MRKGAEEVPARPFELIPLPIDLRSAEGAIQVSVLEVSGLPYVVQGKYDWRAPSRVLVARKHYEEAMRVLETAPCAGPVLVQKIEGFQEPAPGSGNRYLVWLGAFLVVWIAYGLFKARP